MLKSWLSAVSIGLAALGLTGCETSGVTVASPVSSYAALPDVAVAPIPATKPTTDLAMASLAADVESGTDMQSAMQPTTVAFAPVTGNTAINPVMAVASKVVVVAPKAIPTEAIEVASAGPVNVSPVAHTMRDRECLMRAMYFESNRSSRDGELAVGTVVMHRIKSGIYPNTVCGVVGQPRQFAPGVMTRRMQGDTTDLAALADSILGGLRHPKIFDKVMFFHTAGLKFPYGNMHYVLVAGGNTFYEKLSRRRLRHG
jgi:spore germination cell wall hydrolase CwlJ-like protein